ncbi:MAG: WYL domain-containing protein [Dehalococcoidia bacterium]|nr:MAG: WYL domain-containing protein [bacterium]MCK6564352.1 WYL domain-containing protein [Dehalococcoidia bacterium]MCL4231021.1 WYL domain-containing protein [Dehalococcoidia bacterium]NUQ56220.1 WYL domain-containing protein [Dehalococcoidia bacterium]RIL01558.1 MAG: hypothetical protein DCC78_10650 [bacterium]
MTEQVRRATRLVEIERLLRKRTQGWSARELAEEVGYSQRTVQRDIAALESELNVPLMLEGRRYRIMPDAGALAPVRFTLQEARALYLATRLFLRHADDRDPDGITALDKLANALPEPIARQVAMTVLQLRERPAQKEENAILCRITEGWARSHTVAIRYRSFQDLSIRSTSLDPYLLEPSATGAATYVIGFSHGHDAVRTFKVERITHAEVTGASFEPPDTSEITRRLAHSWGVVFGDDKFDIVVEFSAAVAPRICETTWHPSQRLSMLPGGGVRMELQLPSLLEFVPWVRSWGHDAMVVAPPELLNEVASSLQAAARAYEETRQPAGTRPGS